MAFGKEGKRNIAFALFFIVGVFIAYYFITENNTKRAINALPVYSPADLNPKLVDKTLQDSAADFTIKDFTKLSKSITSVDFINL